MGKNAATYVYGGTMSFCSSLTILFLILRLCKVIAWKWVFVFMPLIIQAGLIVLTLVVVIALYAIGCSLEKRDVKKKENKNE